MEFEFETLSFQGLLNRLFLVPSTMKFEYHKQYGMRTKSRRLGLWNCDNHQVSKRDFAVNVLGTRKKCMVGSGIGNCNTNVSVQLGRDKIADSVDLPTHF